MTKFNANPQILTPVFLTTPLICSFKSWSIVCSIIGLQYAVLHRCRLFQNIWGQPKYWGKRAAISDEVIGIYQLFGNVPGLLPQSLRLVSAPQTVTCVGTG